MAGECHGRVQGEWMGSGIDHGREHAEAVRSRRVGHDLSGCDRARLHQARDQSGQRVVRHGENHEMDPRRHLVDRHQPRPGQQSLDARSAGIGHTGGGDHRVTGAGEGGTEHGTDPAGTDDADSEGPRQAHGARRSGGLRGDVS